MSTTERSGKRKNHERFEGFERLRPVGLARLHSPEPDHER
jgi:hypothetical protein